MQPARRLNATRQLTRLARSTRSSDKSDLFVQKIVVGATARVAKLLLAIVFVTCMRILGADAPCCGSLSWCMGVTFLRPTR